MALALYILGVILIFTGLLESGYTTKISILVSAIWPIVAVLAAIAFIFNIRVKDDPTK
jgi:hypothetical protein